MLCWKTCNWERSEAILNTRKGAKSAIIFTCALVVIALLVFTTTSLQTEKNSRIQTSFVTANEDSALLPRLVTSESLLLDDKTIQEHDISPNETMVYKTSDDQELNFNKGDSCSLDLQIVDRGFDRGQFVSMGFIYDGDKTPLLEKQIRSGSVVDFTAPDNGLYSFYVECNSSDSLLVESFSIKQSK